MFSCLTLLRGSVVFCVNRLTFLVAGLYSGLCLDGRLHYMPKFPLNNLQLARIFMLSIVPGFVQQKIFLLNSGFIYLQVLLQVLIILTGNYNFFNLLTLTLCLSLLDDQHVRFWLRKADNISNNGMMNSVHTTHTYCKPLSSTLS